MSRPPGDPNRRLRRRGDLAGRVTGEILLLVSIGKAGEHSNRLVDIERSSDRAASATKPTSFPMSRLLDRLVPLLCLRTLGKPALDPAWYRPLSREKC